MKKTSFLLFVLLICPYLYGQNPPKREFRAAWVATVFNLDWPSTSNLTAANQKQEFINILEQHRKAGINVVMVQVRSYCDALYPSFFEPWSDALTGVQGRSPQYDPVGFMVSECHKRGMEFHAWFNPYRAVSNINTAILDSNHISRRHPEWLLSQGNLRILDPGQPEVRNYVASVVLEVVKRYDIDGVHFDDYFYPYPQPCLVLNDDSTYIRNNRGFVDRADWRRDNVDLFVKMMSDTIHALKPWVKFGISPCGIWENKSDKQPLGSETEGLENYNDLFANSRKWVQQGWVDYIAPQVYWSIGFSAANYAVLVPWWNKNAFGRHVYIGQAGYKIGSDTSWNATQLPRQLQLNRHFSNILGSIYYNSTSLKNNALGFRDSLEKNYYQYPALLPTMKWRDSIPPSVTTDLKATRSVTNVKLSWSKPHITKNELNRVRQFVVYRFDDYASVDLNDAKAIRCITPNDTTGFTDNKVRVGQCYTYVVTALDRLQNESAPSSNAVVNSNPSDDLLNQNFQIQVYPNPINDVIEICYELPKNDIIDMTINDLYSQKKIQLVKQLQIKGRYTIPFHSENLPSGIYFICIKTDEGSKMIKIIKQP